VAQTRIEVYRDTGGHWRWRAKAPNGRVVADGGEGYHNKADLLATLADLFPIHDNAYVVMEVVDDELDEKKT
jgi:uncharacterized protein YegP (UPF0339 family)